MPNGIFEKDGKFYWIFHGMIVEVMRVKVITNIRTHDCQLQVKTQEIWVPAVGPESDWKAFAAGAMC